MKAVINKIIPFSSVDGPGNRTAVFLQGCNINCKYCHNPETRGMCQQCGICVKNCPVGALTIGEMGNIIYDEKKCMECDTCIHVCPHDSSPRTYTLSVEEVYQKVKKQIPFIRGITVSGGECMLRPDFLKELFILAKKDGLTTLIDTNGTISFEEQEDLLEVTDGVMIDIKAFDNAEHQKITDVSNEIVLKNTAYLAERKKLYEVRAVIVPDLYDTMESVKNMGMFLSQFLPYGSFRIKLIAYRPIGVREEYRTFEIPSRTYLEELEEILKGMGFQEIIII
ncbi:MAG: YjjW family glycine radical enzyme activase [Lachnospiraceae bacterium]|nr:YjjW family glycine radical enzyme activase [Lachnospiraceae bacterium]